MSSGSFSLRLICPQRRMWAYHCSARIPDQRPPATRRHANNGRVAVAEPARKRRRVILTGSGFCLVTSARPLNAGHSVWEKCKANIAQAEPGASVFSVNLNPKRASRIRARQKDSELLDCYLAVLDIDREPVGVFPHRGQRQFDLFVDGALQKTSAIGGTETLFDQVSHRRLADLDPFTLVFHLAFHFAQIEFRDLLHLVLGQRRKDHYFIYPVP